MQIEVLVCYPDGRQQVETREVPEDWFPEEAAPEATTRDILNAMLGVSENG